MPTVDWESQVTVSDRLAVILDRMLLAAPSQRFQSAEVIVALTPAKNHHLPVVLTAVLPSPSTTTTPPPPPRARPATTLELLTGAALVGLRD